MTLWDESHHDIGILRDSGQYEMSASAEKKKNVLKKVELNCSKTSKYTFWIFVKFYGFVKFAS